MAKIAYIENGEAYIRDFEYGDVVGFISKILMNNFNELKFVKEIFKTKGKIYSISYSKDEYEKIVEGTATTAGAASAKMLKMLTVKIINGRAVFFKQDKASNSKMSEEDFLKRKVRDNTYLFQDGEWYLWVSGQKISLKLIVLAHELVFCYKEKDLHVEFFKKVDKEEIKKIIFLIKALDDQEINISLGKYFGGATMADISRILAIPKTMLEEKQIGQAISARPTREKFKKI